MRSPGGILLTGATGMLGRYLLREMLLTGQPVGVLVRDRAGIGAGQRIDELITFWSTQLGRPLPHPVVLDGDLVSEGLGLSSADRDWVSRHCDCVLHAGAHVGFVPTAGGEPWRTNLKGTRRLLELAQQLGITGLHHVSTAYVCGTRTGTIHENDLDCGQGFSNDYERSKFEAERLLRQAEGILVTVYRPSVIVGDSRTGYTSSYQGIYHFLELGHRLASATPDGRRRLDIRLPFTGDEPRNLVPVDWVAGAIGRIVSDPGLHGRTYHLVADRPVAARFISDVAAEVLGIDGHSWVGPDGLRDPSSLEQLFLEAIADYRPYWQGDPTFRSDNAREALPDLPPPMIDRKLIVRLIRHAVADSWGRRRGRGRRCTNAGFNCAHYLEYFFPGAVRQSSLAGIPLDILVGLDVRGTGGGRWSCRWIREELRPVEKGLSDQVDVLYRMDVPTFTSITAGRVSVQEAFFTRQVEIIGDIEKGLKLAVLFSQFVREHPYPPTLHRETADAHQVG